MKSRIMIFCISLLSLVAFTSCKKEFEIKIMVVNMSATDIAAAHTGGEYAFYFYATNSVEDDIVLGSSDVEWIYDVSVEWDFDDDTMTGCVTFKVDPSGDIYAREGNVILTYVHSSTALMNSPICVTQAGKGSLGNNFSNEDMIGTYTAEAKVPYIYNMIATVEWPLYILPDDEDGLYIDGLVPDTNGMYEFYGDNRLSAAAHLNSDSELVVPSGLTDYVMSLIYADYYIGYTPCGQYSSASGASYYYDSFPDLTFTYNSYEGTWNSDYGVFCVACTEESLDSIDLCLSTVYPSISLTKVSDEVPDVSGDDGDDDADDDDDDGDAAPTGLSIDNAKKAMSAKCK